jgi:tetratricopeptide (TPR) repeat protein
MWVVHLVLVGLLLSLAPDGSAAQNKNDRVPPEIRLAAESAMTTGRLPEALAALKKGLAIDPAWTDGLWKIGLVLYQSDQFEAALPYLRKLTELDPAKGAGWALLGMCELQAGRPKEAVEHIDHADRIGITGQFHLWEIAYLDRGLAHIALGNFAEATEVLRKMVPREDPDERARLVLALGYAALNLPLDRSLSSAQHALLQAVGEACYLNYAGNASATDAAFAELFRQFPQLPRLHYAYGSVLLSRIDYEGAGRQFRAELANDTDSLLARLGLAFVALETGDVQGGLPYAKEAVQQQPDRYQPHLYYGRLLLQVEQAQEAAVELETARRIAPGNAAVRLALANAYRLLGRKDKAAVEFAEYQRLKPPTEPANAQSKSSAPVNAVPKP